MCGDCDMLLGAGVRAVDDVEGFVPFLKNAKGVNRAKDVPMRYVGNKQPMY